MFTKQNIINTLAPVYTTNSERINNLIYSFDTLDPDLHDELQELLMNNEGLATILKDLTNPEFIPINKKYSGINPEQIEAIYSDGDKEYVIGKFNAYEKYAILSNYHDGKKWGLSLVTFITKEYFNY